MSRVVARLGTKVVLLNVSRRTCPVCARHRDSVKVVEERPVMGEEDYRIPRLIVLDTYRSPRGSIEFSPTQNDLCYFWICTGGSDPYWTSYNGWNEVNGRLFIFYSPETKIAKVGDRIARGEGFYTEAFMQFRQDRDWILMADRKPLAIEPRQFTRYHRACAAGAIAEKVEPVAVQGHLEIYRVPEEDSDLRNAFWNAPYSSLSRYGTVSMETRSFLNHHFSREGDGESVMEKVRENRLAFRRKAEEADVWVSPDEFDSSREYGVGVSQRDGVIYGLIDIPREAHVISPDHMDEPIHLDPGRYALLHPAPRDEGVD